MKQKEKRAIDKENEEILKAKEIADSIVKSFIDARDAAKNASQYSLDNDEIPF